MVPDVDRRRSVQWYASSATPGSGNVVWLTADLHDTAAHYYDPNAPPFQEFAPFWEFVSGQLNAGTFGPNPLDDMFDPKVVSHKAPPADRANLAPSACSSPARSTSTAPARS